MLVIIGSGLAGYMLAKEWRKRDPDTALTIITAGLGDFYSKPLLSTALTQQKTPAQLAMTPATGMAEQLNARILTQTTVQSIDLSQRQVRVANETIRYDKLVLAVGATPISLSLQGEAANHLMTVNDLEAYATLRERLMPGKSRVAIIGTGLVGCEFANDLLNVGTTVEMVSLESYPLARLVPEPVGRALAAAFSAQGARWHFGVGAVGLHPHPTGLQLELSNGSRIVADIVLSAVGLQPNVALARAAGLKVQRGICVNRTLQTSDPHVYALGDCAEVEGHVLQYVAPLLLCAKTLAHQLVEPATPVVYPPMPIVIKTPLCPIVTLPASPQVEGHWHYAGEGQDQAAYFYDAQERLQGFALSGVCVRERFELVKRMPPLIA